MAPVTALTMPSGSDRLSGYDTGLTMPMPEQIGHPVRSQKFSAAAKEKIAAAGGSTTEAE